MRRTIVARTADEIDDLRYFWESLEIQPSATMFQSFTWNHVAAKVFAEREGPIVVYSVDDSGAALIPTAVDLSRSRLTLLGETVFDYRDVLCVGDQQALSSAWSRLSEAGMKFAVAGIRSKPSLSSWSQFNLSPFYGAPCISPATVSASDFASEHGRLARWKRRLERDGASLKCHTGGNSELVRLIYERKGNQPAEIGENLFCDRLRQQFMVEVCRNVGSTCEIFTFEAAGTLIAALVTFRDRNTRRFYTVYFDERWAKYSPGTVLIYEVTCRSLENGLECDYMTGEHLYKMRFATSVVPMYWAEASPKALAGGLAHEKMAS